MKRHASWMRSDIGQDSFEYVHSIKTKESLMECRLYDVRHAVLIFAINNDHGLALRRKNTFDRTNEFASLFLISIFIAAIPWQLYER